MAGLRGNVEVAIRYLAAWLGGNGAVGIHGLMEDAATAEISRSQVWQWVHAGVVLDTGETVTEELVRRVDRAQRAVQFGENPLVEGHGAARIGSAPVQGPAASSRVVGGTGVLSQSTIE